MMLSLLLGISLAGGAGAATRFVADEAFTKWFGSSRLAERLAHRFGKRFSGTQGWGILAVNVTGSFLVGILAGPLALVSWGQVVTMGFLGGYTTFSTASLNSVRIALDRELGRSRFYQGAAYALVTYLLSVFAAVLGLMLGSALF